MLNYNENDDEYTYNEYICNVIYLHFLYFVEKLYNNQGLSGV